MACVFTQHLSAASTYAPSAAAGTAGGGMRPWTDGHEVSLVGQCIVVRVDPVYWSKGWALRRWRNSRRIERA